MSQKHGSKVSWRIVSLRAGQDGFQFLPLTEVEEGLLCRPLLSGPQCCKSGPAVPRMKWMVTRPCLYSHVVFLFLPANHPSHADVILGANEVDSLGWEPPWLIMQIDAGLNQMLGQFRLFWGLGIKVITEVVEARGGESSLGPVAEGCKLLWDLEFHGLLSCLVPSQGDSSCPNSIYSAEHSQPPLPSPGYRLRNLQLQAALG